MRSNCFKQVSRVLITLIISFLGLVFFFNTPANAQARVTGLGYIGTKSFNDDNSTYFPIKSAFDSSDNYYIVGEIYDDSYDPTNIDLNWNSGSAISNGTFFLSKYSPEKVYMWGITLGTLSGDVGAGGIALDSSGNIYLSGDFNGTVDFDFTAGTDSKTATSSYDAFIMKINSNGTYGWTKTWGGTEYDYAYNLAVDTTRNALYVAGHLYSPNVDIDPGAGSVTSANSGFLISKFDLDGNFQWGNVYGNLGGLFEHNVRIKESTGDVYVGSGISSNTTVDFDPGAGDDSITTGAVSSSFITKLTPTNTYLGTVLLAGVELKEFVFDSSENIYIAGRFENTVDFDPSTNLDSISSSGSRDSFVTKWNVSANPFDLDNPYAWTQRFGGTGSEFAFALDTDTYGNVYIGGGFTSTNVDFDFSGSTDIHSAMTNQAWSYITVINNDGTYLKTYSWGRNENTSYAYSDLYDLGIDSKNRVYAMGAYLEDTDFDPSANEYILGGPVASTYNTDIFVSIFYPYIAVDINDPVGNLTVPGESFSSDSYLMSLTTSEGPVAPSFSAVSYSYTLDVDGTVETVSITATSADTNSRLAVNGYALVSGVASSPIPLSSGANEINVVVTSEDLTETSTYTITVNKPVPQGSEYTYISSKQLGDLGSRIEVENMDMDSTGNFYVSGTFRDGPVDFGVPSNGDDMLSGTYLMKLDSSQNPLWVLRWTYDFSTSVPFVLINDLMVDSNDNIVAVGSFGGTVDLDPTTNTDSRASGGPRDAHMIMINSNGTVGNILTWGSTFFEDYSYSVDMDSTGNIYVGGTFMSSLDLDPTEGEYIVTYGFNRTHAFVTKFTETGGFTWSKTYETTASSSSGNYVQYSHINVDVNGNVYSLGRFRGINIDFDPSASTDIFSEYNGGSIYISKLDINGNYQWTKTITSQDYIDVVDGGLDSDSLGNVVLGGTFSTDGDVALLDPNNQTIEYSSISSTDDVFLIKLDATGDTTWVKTYGGSSWDSLKGLTINLEDNIFVFGYFDDTVDFDPSAGVDNKNVIAGGGSGYVMQINSSDSYIWTKTFDSDDWVEVSSVVFPSIDEMFVGGVMYGTTDLDPSISENAITAIGLYDGFIANFGQVTQDNANLSNLESTQGIFIPDFDPNTTAYTIVLDAGITSLALRPTAQDFNISGITVNGTSVTNGEFGLALPLNLGNNIFEIIVTAGDGITTKTYTLTVWRDDGSTPPYSTDTRLSSLTISSGTLNPVFSTNTRTYTVEVTSDITNITLTPTLFDPDAYSLQVNGSNVVSGTSSQSISLDPGDNTVTITVIAEDRRTVDTYTVSIYRDTNPYLTGLKLDWGNTGFEADIRVSALDICTTSDGSSYTLGQFEGTDVNLGYPDGTAIYSVSTGYADSYLIKRDNQGAFVWAKVFAGPNELLSTCTIDSNDNLYIGGYFEGTTDLNLNAGIDSKTAIGRGDAFVSIYDSSDTYIESFVFGSSDVSRSDKVTDIEVTAQHIFVGGSMYASDFDADGTSGVSILPNLAHGDVFISKFNISDRTFVNAISILGENLDEEVIDIETDSTGNVYVGGYWGGPTIDFDSTAGVDTKTAANEDRHIYLTKFSNTLGYQWTRIVESYYDTEILNQIEVVSDNEIYMIVNARAETFFEGYGTSHTPVDFYSDGILLKYSSTGTLDAPKILSSNNSAEYNGITVFNNKIYISGSFRNILDVDFTEGSRTLTSTASMGNAFVQIFDTSLNYLNAVKIGLSNGGKLANSIDGIYMFGKSWYPRENISPTYIPYYLSTQYTQYNHLYLIKYLETPINRVFNTNTSYAVIDSIFSSPVNTLYFTPEEDVVTSIIQQGTIGSTNILEQENPGSTIYQQIGTKVFAGDDDTISLDLPFEFPFYDDIYTNIQIGTNGMICFDLTKSCDGYLDSGYDDTFFGPFISPLTLDTETDVTPQQGIYIDSTTERFIVSWRAQEYGYSGTEIEYSLILYPNGEFEFVYGPQTQNFSSSSVYIGVGAGDGIRYTQASNDGLLNYNQYPTLKWSPAAKPTKLANFNLDMSINRDISSISGDMDKQTGKSVIQNTQNIAGLTDIDMYIPYRNDLNISRVLVCPEATNLSEISYSCNNAQLIKVGLSGITNTTYLGDPYLKITNALPKGVMAVSANTFTVSASDTQLTEGESTSITITVIDSEGNPDPDYEGTIDIISNITGLSTTYTFLATDNGSKVFSDIAINGAGSYVVTAQDTLDEEILGVSTSIVVTAPIEEPGDESPTEEPTTPGGGTTNPPTNEDPVEIPEENPDESPNENPEVDDDESPTDEDDKGSDEQDDETTNTGVFGYIVDVFNSIVEDIRDILESPEKTERVAYTATGILIAISVTSATIGTTYPLAYVLQIGTLFFAGLKIKNKERGYGVVYNSTTKEPLNRAIVRIFDIEGKIVTTAVTNTFGAFDVNLPEGVYSISVQVRDHVFPSRVIKGGTDMPYENIYNGQQFNHNPNTPITFSIPVDPIDKSFVEYASVVFRNRIHNLFNALQNILLIGGFIFVLITYINLHRPIDLIILILYSLLILLNLYIYIKGRRKYGVVKDIYNDIVQGVNVGLRETEFDTIYARRITDEKGRYRFIVPGGKYKLEMLDENLTINTEKELTYDTDSDKILNINPDLELRRK